MRKSMAQVRHGRRGLPCRDSTRAGLPQESCRTLQNCVTCYKELMTRIRFCGSANPLSSVFLNVALDESTAVQEVCGHLATLLDQNLRKWPTAYLQRRPQSKRSGTCGSRNAQESLGRESLLKLLLGMTIRVTAIRATKHGRKLLTLFITQALNVLEDLFQQPAHFLDVPLISPRFKSLDTRDPTGPKGVNQGLQSP